MRANRGREVGERTQLLHLAGTCARQQAGDGDLAGGAAIAEHDFPPLDGGPQRAFGAVVRGLPLAAVGGACSPWASTVSWGRTLPPAPTAPGTRASARRCTSPCPMPTSTRSDFRDWTLGECLSSRTAVYGPVRTVVWEGRGREAPPYPDPPGPRRRRCESPSATVDERTTESATGETSREHK